MIRVQDVSFTYGAHGCSGLAHISLRVPRGECLLLAGGSGSGKTTLTRLVNGLIPAFYGGEMRGRILVRGRDLAHWPKGELSAVVGSVFQNPRSQFFNPDTTSEIAFGCENQGLDRQTIHKRVADAVAMLGIDSLLGKSVFSLSGGERQMVAIASAYAAGAEVFVLDEPSANLDSRGTARLAAALQRLKAMGRTILIAEHRLHYLTGVADRVAYLDRGRLAELWSMPEFLGLSRRERQERGLRCRDLACLNPPSRVAQPFPGPADCQVQSLQFAPPGHGTILRSVSCSLGREQVLGLVGGNGLGKTTLARCLCGLRRERGGSVRLHDQTLSARQRLGRFYLVMQEPACQLFTGSVRAELELGIDAKSGQPGLADKILRMLGLEGVRERHPMSLSGGEKQRLAIAVAVVREAEVLILDEPTSGLDYTSMQRVREVVELLRAMGKRLCVITHDLEFLTHVCDHVLELESPANCADYPLIPANLDRLRRAFGLPPEEKPRAVGNAQAGAGGCA
ncbi:MAG: ABC transporter ATP-binding protein [Pseudodesulfovibrio sp.]